MGVSTYTVAPLRASKLQTDFAFVTPVGATKTADQTVNNSTVLVNDNELFVTLAAAATYAGRIVLYSNSAAVADIKFGLSLPTGAAGFWGGVGYDSTSTLLTFGPLALTVALGFGGLATDKLAYIDMTVTTTVAGSMTVQFAQNTANASNTILRAGSYLMLQRIS